MAEKKSIVEEALLDVNSIKNALNANTKEILRSVAREEIDSVVKESLLREDDYEEEDLNQPKDSGTELGGAANAATDDVTGDIGGDESGLGGLDDIQGSEEVGTGMDSELGMDPTGLGGDDMDMTASSDDDVIAIYKKLSGEDEIEIVGDEIHLSISEPGDYIVKTNEKSTGGLGATSEVPTDLEPVGDEMGGEEGGTDYEIEMGDEGGAEAPAAEPIGGEEGGVEGGEEEEKEEGLEETMTHTLKNGHDLSLKPDNFPDELKRPGLKESASKKMVSETVKKYNTLLTETKKLKAENDDFRKALKIFRGQLVETVVFNSNLTYATRLFLEHSTTKVEKESILKRFDNEVSNLIESKKLYKTIASELENRKPINEAIEKKIIKEVSTSASKLNESTAYVDQSTARIIDLMNRVGKR
jgi:uncharacterized protein (DUF1697 family)